MKSKKIISALLALVCLFSSVAFATYAANNSVDEIQASGLIFRFNLAISKENSTTLYIEGSTVCDPVVVKCGFKNLKVQRRANSTTSWSDFYDYGNVYDDSDSAIISRYLPVDPGYQYRVTCKHYAKKNILNTQSISNTSNIVTF
jgi:hypothetical protein